MIKATEDDTKGITAALTDHVRQAGYEEGEGAGGAL